MMDLKALPPATEVLQKLITAIARDVAREDHERAKRGRKGPRKKVLIPRKV
jgi:hypothetical protein